MSIENAGNAAVSAASGRIAAAVASRVADSALRRQRVIAALDAAERHGHRVSVAGIVESAAIHRVFLYRHRDLLDRLRALQTGPPAV